MQRNRKIPRMSQGSGIVAALCLLLPAWTVAPAQARRNPVRQIHAQKVVPKPITAGSNSRVRFEPNLGHMAPQVRFVAKGGGGTAFLTGNSIDFTLTPATRSTENTTVGLVLTGANPNARAEGIGGLPGVSNYFLGNDPARWRQNVPGYAKVRYEDVYPGIDLLLHGDRGALEYDFAVAPGADPSLIRFTVRGTDCIEIDRHGDLVLRCAAGEIRQRAPRLIQGEGESQKLVAGRFERHGAAEVGFAIQSFDPARALTIDPEIVYSTYLGGSGDEGEFGNLGFAVGDDGSVYVAGTTSSANFPVEQPLRGTRAGGKDGFVTKLAPDGSLAYSTYLGGSESEDEGLKRITLAPDGSVIVTGYTSATNYPTMNAFQSQFGGGFSDAVVTRLSPSGDALVYSTYLGGSGSDHGDAIDVNAGGFAFVAGTTGSPNFPNQGGAQTGFGGGGLDGFVTILTPAGGLDLSTFVGGSGFDWIETLMVDDELIVAGGHTDSPDFSPGSGEEHFALIAHIEYGDSAARGQRGMHYVRLLRFALEHPECGGSYLIKQLFRGKQMRYSTITTYQILVEFRNRCQHGQLFDTLMVNPATGEVKPVFLSPDESEGIQVLLQLDEIIRTVETPPRRPAPGESPGAGRGGARDIGVERIDVETGEVELRMTIGGSGDEESLGVDVDAQGNVYVLGRTNSTDFPTAGQFVQGQLAGGYDAFVVKIADLLPPPSPDFTLSLPTASLTVNKGQKGTVAVNVDRTGGFDGQVTVVAPDTKPIKIKLTPASVPTSGNSVTFNFKVKKKAAAGTYSIAFTGRDGEGRERTATFTFVIQ